MFNGIVTHTGKVVKIIKKKNDFLIHIKTKLKLLKIDIGTSICCSGACLTLVNIKKNILIFYISKETVRKTNFKYIKKHSIINLERSLKYNDRISGHFVQGHIDLSSKIKSIKQLGKSWFVQIEIPAKFKKFIAYKGSITVNGVSLTISKILNQSYEIVVIPHTLKETNLYYIKQNDIVNIEFDILSKYINNFKNEKV